MQNKWHLTFLERFSKKKPPLRWFGWKWGFYRFSGTHWSILVIDISFWPLEPIESKGGFHIDSNVNTKRWGLCACSFAWEWSYLCLWIIRNHFKGTQTHWINLWINFSSVFIVLMPLKTSFDKTTTQVSHVSVFSYLAPHVLMSVFVYKVASSYHRVIMYVPDRFCVISRANWWVGCAEKINNKVLWGSFCAVIC